MSLGTAFPAGFQAGSSAVDRGLAARDRRTQMEQEEQAKKIESHNKRKEQFVKMINEFVKGAHAKDPETAVRQIGEFKRSKAISQQMQLYAVMDQVYGQNPTVTLQQFENAFNQPSPQQLAEEEGRTEGITEFGKAAGARDVASYQNFTTGQVMDIDFNDPEFDSKSAEARKQGFRRIKTPTVEFQAQGGLTSSQAGKIETENIEQETLVRQNVQSAQEIINLVSQPEFVGGTAGNMLSSINSFNSQLKQLVGADDIIKDGVIDETKVDPELSQDNWSFIKEAAVSKDRVEGAIIQLAYTLAKMRDPGGRLSDADVAMARKTIESGASKESIINLLRDGQKRAIQFYNTEIDVLNRRVEGVNFKKLDINEILQITPEQDETTVEEMLRKSGL